MKNIIDEKPTDALEGQTLFSTQFVSDEDVFQKNILDVGCGYGWFELNAIQRGAFSITGTEESEESLATAIKYAKDEKIRFQVGDATDLPFNSDTFDTVVSWAVIEHIPVRSELKMLSEVHRVLKKHGAFYLSTPYAHIASNVLDPAWWLIGHRHYSKDTLVKMAEKSGFSVVDTVIKGGFWEILAVNNLYLSKWIFRRRPFFERTINAFQNKEYQKNNGFTNIFIKFRKI